MMQIMTEISKLNLPQDKILLLSAISPKSHAEHTAPQGPVLHWLSADGTFQLLWPGWRPGSWGYP